ncbi:MAG: hypothetical protein LW823_05225 [Rickettsiales bacterium]|jgi:hypothetical protein|nr:hypothetical protein [Rickettsiales bacterium]
MNMKWVIIGTIFIVLLVAFGRNPVQEAREQRRKEIEEKGILGYEIEKHLEQQRSPFGMRPGMAPTTGPTRIPSSSLPPESRFPQGAVPVEPAPASPVAPVMPAQPAQPQGYYPPPPQPDNAVPVFDPSAPRSERSGSDIKRLADGVAVEYFGAKVFTKTADGKSMRLPDGKYLIDGGRFLMVVEGGERADIMAYAAP